MSGERENNKMKIVWALLVIIIGMLFCLILWSATIPFSIARKIDAFSDRDADLAEYIDYLGSQYESGVGGTFLDEIRVRKLFDALPEEEHYEYYYWANEGAIYHWIIVVYDTNEGKVIEARLEHALRF